MRNESPLEHCLCFQLASGMSSWVNLNPLSILLCGTWICTRCFVRCSSPGLLPSARRRCAGVSHFDRLLRDPKGHELWGTGVLGRKPLIYCKLCWHYCSAYSRKLKVACLRGDSCTRPSVKSYLRKGLHPISREPFSCPIRLV